MTSSLSIYGKGVFGRECIYVCILHCRKCVLIETSFLVCVHGCVCVGVCVGVRMYVHVCVFMFIHAYMYIYNI